MHTEQNECPHGWSAVFLLRSMQIGQTNLSLKSSLKVSSVLSFSRCACSFNGTLCFLSSRIFAKRRDLVVLISSREVMAGMWRRLRGEMWRLERCAESLSTCWKFSSCSTRAVSMKIKLQKSVRLLFGKDAFFRILFKSFVQPVNLRTQLLLVNSYYLLQFTPFFTVLHESINMTGMLKGYSQWDIIFGSLQLFFSYTTDFPYCI